MSARREGPGAWIPLMEYAVKKGVSLSTLRRYIKAKRVQFRIEEGRYLLWDEESSPAERSALSVRATLVSAPAPAPMHDSRIAELEARLRLANEEIAELKMLVALYEEQLSQSPPQMFR